MSKVIEHLRQQTAFTRFLDTYSRSTRKFIVFCGAGASREAGFPDWDELAALVRKEMNQPIYSTEFDKDSIQNFDNEDNLWKKFSISKNLLAENYYTTIDSILNRKSRTPKFFTRVWDLRLSGLVTMNLDGLAQQGFVETTGKNPNIYTGREAFSARDAFLDTENPTIIELHGNVRKRESWILTEDDYNQISNEEAYKQFLRSIFSQSLVLIYGLSAGDISVNGQLTYLNSIKSANGEYFLLKRLPSTESDRSLSRELGIQPIYLPSSETWEKGFEEFTNYVSKFQKKDPKPSIVLSDKASDEELPSTAELLTLPPDEVRLRLNAASRRFIDNEDEFRTFKEKYDLAIHHAARVRLGTENGNWLGYKLITELGSGNFGRVFQASDHENNNHVAIKIAHEAVRDNPVMLDSFRRGVASMRYLSASGIEGTVKLIDASELPPSIIMEHIVGINFEEIVNHGYLKDTIDVLKTILRISKIVFSCHTNEISILHRDLRPQNIMIGGEFWDEIKDEFVNVLDFDLSWFEGATGQDYYMPATSALGYLAPEQLDKNSKYSARSALVDVYGLSMLFYFSLAKQHPSAAAPTRDDWPNRIHEASLKAFSSQWKCLPARIEKILLEGTHKEQERRPMLPAFIEIIEELIDLTKIEFRAKPQIILHEMFYRIFGKSVQQGEHSYTNYSGVKLSAFPLYDKGIFKFVIDAVAMDSANRVNLGKYLSISLNKAKDIVKKVGTIDVKDSHVGQSRMKLSFSIDVPQNFVELDEYTRVLDQAISAMRID